MGMAMSSLCAGEAASMGREAEVWRAMARVTDPELDESVTDMGFITRVECGADNHCRVAFRLPTFWCAPNFAFMMAQDMRAAILSLEGVRAVTVILVDHMYAEAINRGVNENLGFRETFGKEASGNLDDLRQTFLRKAFQWRQEALMSHLLKSGMCDQQLVQLTVGQLRAIATAGERDGEKLVHRYLERRHVVGRFLDSDLAFVAIDAAPLKAEGIKDHLRTIRRVRTNAEFNGALCRGLLNERFATNPIPT